MVKSAGLGPVNSPRGEGLSRGATGSTLTRWGWIVATVSAILTGCGGSPSTSEQVSVDVESSSHTDIVGGAPDFERASGVVALRVGTSAPYEICSGALVAPNVVLTARHCVSKMVATSVICTDRGQSANGPHVGGDHRVEELAVFASETPDFDGAPDAHATAVIHADGTSLCNSDIALLVIDRTPAGTSPLPVRLGRSVSPRESIRAVGYGKSESSTGPGMRMRKDGIGILEVGAKLTASDTALGDKEFEVGRSICQGDSGGPSISESTGAVVGVVSRGADCRQDFGHVYTQTSGFESLFAAALIRGGSKILTEDGEIVSGEELAASGAPAAGGCAVARAGTKREGGAGSLAALALLGLAIARVRARRVR